MAPSVNDDDYYSFLGIPHTATAEEIVKTYKTLARAWHPDKNGNKPSATALFQKLGNVYDILKDASTRAVYDRTRSSFRQSQSTQFPTPSAGPKGETETTPFSKEFERLRNESAKAETALVVLRSSRLHLFNQVSECKKCVTQIEAVLSRMKKEDEEDKKIDLEANTWWTRATSSIFGERQEYSAEGKGQREIRRLQRVATIRIKQPELSRALVSLKEKEDAMAQVDAAIERETTRLERIQQERASLLAKQREEEMKKQNAEREQHDEAERKRTAEIFRRAQEERKRKEETFRREQEERIKKENAERNRREEERKKRREEASRRARETPKSSATCSHSKYWQQIDGRGECGHCHKIQPRFTFECPDCRFKACAGCRTILKAEKGRGARNSRAHFQHYHADFTDYDEPYVYDPWD